MLFYIVSHRYSWENKQILKELRKSGMQCKFVPIQSISFILEPNKVKVFSYQNELKKPDLALLRTGKEEWKEVINLLWRYWKKMNVKLIENPECIRFHKETIALDLCLKNLSHPKTFFSISKNLSTVDKLFEYPLVAKDIFVHRGERVFKINNKKELSRSTKSSKNEYLYVQEFIPSAREDTRVMIIGNEVIGAMRRIAKSGEFRSNVAAGGKGKKYYIDKKMKKLALKATKLFGYEIVGVDFIEYNNKPTVLEVNWAPQFREFTRVTGINVAEKIAGHLIKKVKNRNR